MGGPRGELARHATPDQPAVLVQEGGSLTGIAEEVGQDRGAAEIDHPVGELDHPGGDPRDLGDHDHSRSLAPSEDSAGLALVREAVLGVVPQRHGIRW